MREQTWTGSEDQRHEQGVCLPPTHQAKTTEPRDAPTTTPMPSEHITTAPGWNWRGDEAASRVRAEIASQKASDAVVAQCGRLPLTRANIAVLHAAARQLQADRGPKSPEWALTAALGAWPRLKPKTWNRLQ